MDEFSMEKPKGPGKYLLKWPGMPIEEVEIYESNGALWIEDSDGEISNLEYAHPEIQWSALTATPAASTEEKANP